MGEAVYRFQSFQVSPARRVMSRSGQAVRVTAKVFDLLLMLLRHRHRVVSRDELLTALWPDTVVEDGSLSVNISALRRALGERHADRPLIETVPRFGYRFIADVVVEAEHASGSVADACPDLKPTSDQPLQGRAHGSGQPLAAATVPAAPDAATVFVGRERELHWLEALFERATRGQPQLAFIHGEPGIGKTTLAQHFLHRAQRSVHDVRVAVGRCLRQHGTGEAYLPFSNAFTALLSGPEATQLRQLFETHAPGWCRQLPAPFATTQLLAQGATSRRGGHLLREAHALLSRLAEDRPLVLLIEDLQWADPSSLDLLRWLCASNEVASGLGAAGRWLVVGTFRAAEVWAPSPQPHELAVLIRELRIHERCVELPLDALSAESADEYLSARFPAHRFPAELSEMLLRKTRGHPLLFTRLVQWLVDTGEIVGDGLHARLNRRVSEFVLEVPSSVESLIASKLDFLTLDEQRVLTHASIEGEEFTSTVVASLLGVDDVGLDETLERLARVHRWFDRVGEETWPSGTVATRYRFGHALYRDYLHAQVVPKRSRQLHQRVALALIEHHGARAKELAAALASHFDQSGDVENALKYHTQAGENAKRAFAYREADLHFSEALARADLLPFERRAPHQISLLCARAWRRHDLGEYEQALADFQRLQQLAEQLPDDDARWQAVTGSAWTYLRRLDGDGFQRKLEELLAIARASGDERRLAEALNHRAAMCVFFAADPPAARAHLAGSLTLARQTGHERALIESLQLSAIVDFLQARYRPALEKYGELIELTRTSGFVGLEMAVVYQYESGLSKLNVGRFAAALADIEGARSFADERDCAISRGVTSNCLAGIHLELESYPEAIRQSRAVLAMTPVHADAYAQLHAHLDLALAHIRMDPPDLRLAELELAAAERLVESKHRRCYRFMAELRLHAVRSELALRRGDSSAAAESARQLVALAGPRGAQKHLALGHWLLARACIACGAVHEAKAELGEALNALAEAPMPRLAWRLWTELGFVERELGDAAAAALAFESAAGELERIAHGLEPGPLRDAFHRSRSVHRCMNAMGTRPTPLDR